MGRATGRAVAASACLFLMLEPLGMTASADELSWTHYGLRPLAMGNAFVAVADDFNALFYNPAGLARLKEWDGEFLNPYGEISGSAAGFINDGQKLAGGSGGDSTAVLDLLEKNTGKTHHVGLGLTPHLVFPGFGFGVGAKIDFTFAVHREISADVEFGPKIVAPVAFAFNLLEDRLSLGAGLKLVARGGIDRQFSINDIEAFTSSSDAEEAGAENTGPKLEDFVEGGMGVGADVGMLFTPIKTMEPTLGISITDFGGTPYKKLDVSGEALGAPQTRLPSVNTGVSIKPWQANNMYVRASADAHAVNQPIHYSKKFNMGVEWAYGSLIKVQSGLHQGAFSGGFEFDVFLFTMRFVTYAEQLGTYAGQDKNLEDRRYALQLKLLI